VNQPGGGLGWEYYFNYAGGRAPWVSGMAQAVAAQAFAAASLSDEDDSTKLEQAAQGRPSHDSAAAGASARLRPLIRLYGFSHYRRAERAVYSRCSRCEITPTQWPTVTRHARRGNGAGSRQRDSPLRHRLLTYYSLPRTPSTLDYQKFVVHLLGKLNSLDPRLATATARFAGYAKQPPAFKIASSGLGAVRFWLSKPSTVEMRSPAGARSGSRFTAVGTTSAGKLPARAGAYSVLVKARDWAGNSSSFAGLPLVRVASAANWSVAGSSVSQRKLIMDAAEAGVASRRPQRRPRFRRGRRPSTSRRPG